MTVHDEARQVPQGEPWIAVFPGQGSQSLGMLAALGDANTVVRDTFQEASDLLRSDLWSVAQNGPQSLLDTTTTTQPVMLAAGVACWRLLEARMPHPPTFVAGHSLGEITALVAAGVLTFADAVALVKVRAHAMQAAVPAGIGAMAAVLGLDDDAVRALCAEHAGDEVLEAVNFNAPGQVVVAGHAAAVERLVAAARPAGAKRALLLPVSVPSHCALMQPASEVFRLRLQQMAVSEARIPVLQNTTATASGAPEVLTDRLIDQLQSPVRWTESIVHAVEQGVRLQVECGPGKVLTGLAKRIDRSLPSVEISEPAGLDAAVEALQGSAG